MFYGYPPHSSIRHLGLHTSENVLATLLARFSHFFPFFFLYYPDGDDGNGLATRIYIHRHTIKQCFNSIQSALLVFSPFAACIILWKLVSLAASKYGVFYLFFWRALFLFFSFSFFLPLHHSLVSPPRTIALSLFLFHRFSLSLPRSLLFSTVFSHSVYRASFGIS